MSAKAILMALGGAAVVAAGVGAHFYLGEKSPPAEAESAERPVAPDPATVASEEVTEDAFADDAGDEVVEAGLDETIDESLEELIEGAEFTEDQVPAEDEFVDVFDAPAEEYSSEDSPVEDTGSGHETGDDGQDPPL